LQGNSLSRAPLPVIATIKGALSVGWQRRKSVAIGLLPAALALASIDAAGKWLTLTGANGSAVVRLMLILVDMPIWTVFAVTAHQLILLDEPSKRGFWPCTWSGRETRFLGWLLVAYLLGGGIVLAVGIWFGIAGSFNFVPTFSDRTQALILAFLVVLPVAYVVTPLSLLFPATAIGQRRGMDWAFQISHGAVWRLFLVLFALAAPAIPISLAATDIAEGSSQVGFLIGLFKAILSVIPLIGLSLSFKYLDLRASNHESAD
jgi:hypothetical protein